MSFHPNVATWGCRIDIGSHCWSIIVVRSSLASWCVILWLVGRCPEESQCHGRQKYCSAGIGWRRAVWILIRDRDSRSVGVSEPRSCGVVVIVVPASGASHSKGRAFRQMPCFTYCLWCCCRPLDRYLSRRGDRFDYVEYIPLYQVNTLCRVASVVW